MSRDLTGAQTSVLMASDRAFRDGGEFLDRLGYDTSPEGFHQTAASLVRRGYLEKDRVGGIVRYRLTGRGAERQAAEHSLTRLYGASS